MEKCNCRNSQLSAILARYTGQEGALFNVLQDAQELYGYLPEEVLVSISNHLGRPFSEVYSVVSFYAHFRTQPRGHNLIRVCTGTVCHIMGALQILARISQNLAFPWGGQPGTAHLLWGRCPVLEPAAMLLLLWSMTISTAGLLPAGCLRF